MRGRTVRTPENTSAFLDALCEAGNVTHACEVVGISRRSAYDWREADPEFAAAWHSAQEMATDAMEDEAIRRGTEGTLEPVFYQGRQCGEIRKFSDVLLMFKLNARRPDKYKHRTSNEHTGPGGAPLTPPDLVVRLIPFQAKLTDEST